MDGLGISAKFYICISSLYIVMIEICLYVFYFIRFDVMTLKMHEQPCMILDTQVVLILFS